MNKLFILLALIASPVFAQEPVKETTQEINYYAKDFPSFYAANPGSEIEKSYNRFIVASDNHAKALAACKSCKNTPVIRVDDHLDYVRQLNTDAARRHQQVLAQLEQQTRLANSRMGANLNRPTVDSRNECRYNCTITVMYNGRMHLLQVSTR